MFVFFFQAEDGIRDLIVTGVQTCALPISLVLLSYFPPLDPSLQHRALFELSRHTSDFAVALLGHLLANLAPLGSIAAAVRSVLLEKIIDQPARLLTLLACPDYKD